MTFTQKLFIGTVAVSASIGTAFALTMPANVKSVDARMSGSEIIVEWSAVPDAKSYRVYYSHESILGNGGNYDDFEQTPDAQTTFVFPRAPLPSEKIYVGVLAVDASGNESEGFEVEASVERMAASSASQASSSSAAVSSVSGSASSVTVSPMAIESVQAITATGILVTFTKDVHPGATLNTSYFLTTTGSGIALATERIEVSGRQILIVTSPQTPDTQYVLRLLSSIPAFDDTSATPSEPQVRFRTPPTADIPVPVPTNEGEYGRNPNLPGEIMNPRPTPPTTTPPTSALPDSGLGLLGIVALSGVGAAQRMLRRKHMVV